MNSRFFTSLNGDVVVARKATNTIFRTSIRMFHILPGAAECAIEYCTERKYLDHPLCFSVYYDYILTDLVVIPKRIAEERGINGNIPDLVPIENALLIPGANKIQVLVVKRLKIDDFERDVYYLSCLSYLSHIDNIECTEFIRSTIWHRLSALDPNHLDREILSQVLPLCISESSLSQNKDKSFLVTTSSDTCGIHRHATIKNGEILEYKVQKNTIFDCCLFPEFTVYKGAHNSILAIAANRFIPVPYYTTEESRDPLQDTNILNDKFQRIFVTDQFITHEIIAECRYRFRREASYFTPEQYDAITPFITQPELYKTNLFNALWHLLESFYLPSSKP